MLFYLLTILVVVINTHLVVGTPVPPQEISACGSYTTATTTAFKLTADLHYDADEGCIRITDCPTDVTIDGNGFSVYATMDYNNIDEDWDNIYMFFDTDMNTLENLHIFNVKFHNFGVFISYSGEAVSDFESFSSLTVENCEFHNVFGAAVGVMELGPWYDYTTINADTVHYDLVVKNNKLINHPSTSSIIIAKGFFKSVNFLNNEVNWNKTNVIEVEYIDKKRSISYFYGIEGGVWTDGAGSVTITGNSFTGGSDLPLINTYVVVTRTLASSFINIENNVFDAIDTYCAVAVDTDEGDDDDDVALLYIADSNSRVNVNNNVVQNSNISGIVLQLRVAVGSTVSNNTVKNSVTRGKTWFFGGFNVPYGSAIFLDGQQSEAFVSLIENNVIDNFNATHACANFAAIQAWDVYMPTIIGNKITNIAADDSCSVEEPVYEVGKRSDYSEKLGTNLRKGWKNEQAQKFTKNEKSEYKRDGYFFYGDVMAGIYVFGCWDPKLMNNAISNMRDGLLMSDGEYNRCVAGLVLLGTSAETNNTQISKLYGASKPTCVKCSNNDGGDAKAIFVIEAAATFENVLISEINGGKGGKINGVSRTDTTVHATGGMATGFYMNYHESGYQNVVINKVLSGKNGAIAGVEPCTVMDYPFGPTYAYYDVLNGAELPEGVTTDGANNTCYRYQKPVVQKAVIVSGPNTKRATQVTYIVDVFGNHFGPGVPGELQATVGGFKCVKVDWHSEQYFTCTLHNAVGTNLPVVVTIRQMSSDRIFTAVVDFPIVTPAGLPTCVPPFGAQDPLNPEICNCFSGHAPSSDQDSDCTMDAKCPGKIISASSIDHRASRPKVSFANDRLTITQTSPIVKGRRDTHISLVGVDAVTQSAETCNFPGPIWTKSLSTLDCLDIYTGVIPWSQNSMCGFQKLVGGDASKLIYSANLVMTYRDLISATGKTPSFRVSSESHVVNVEFTRQLTIALDSEALVSVVQEASEIDLLVTSSAMYDPASKETLVNFRTTTNSPYKLTSMSVSWQPAYTPTDPAFGYPELSAALSTLGDAQCGGVPNVCEQDWVLTFNTFVEGSQTCNLKGTVSLMPGALLCRDLSPIAECESTGDIANLTISITDDTFLCDDSEDDVDASQNVESLVSTFIDDVYTTQQDSFQVGDMCYVQIAVKSPQASIDSITFNHITIGEADEELYSIDPVTINPDATFNITSEKNDDGQIVSPGDIAVITFQFKLSRVLASLSTFDEDTESISLEIKVTLDLKFHGNAADIPLAKRVVGSTEYFQSSARHAITLTLPEEGFDEQDNLEENNDLFGDLYGSASQLSICFATIFVVVCALLL